MAAARANRLPVTASLCLRISFSDNETIQTGNSFGQFSKNELVGAYFQDSAAIPFAAGLRAYAEKH
jgi:hypothetical protein